MRRHLNKIGYGLAKAFAELDDEDPRKKIFFIMVIVAILFVMATGISIIIMMAANK